MGFSKESFCSDQLSAVTPKGSPLLWKLAYEPLLRISPHRRLVWVNTDSLTWGLVVVLYISVRVIDLEYFQRFIITISTIVILLRQSQFTRLPCFLLCYFRLWLVCLFVVVSADFSKTKSVFLWRIIFTIWWQPAKFSFWVESVHLSTLVSFPPAYFSIFYFRYIFTLLFRCIS